MDRNLRAFFVIAGPLAPSRFALRRTRRRGRPSGVEGVLDLAIDASVRTRVVTSTPTRIIRALEALETNDAAEMNESVESDAR